MESSLVPDDSGTPDALGQPGLDMMPTGRRIDRRRPGLDRIRFHVGQGLPFRACPPGAGMVMSMGRPDVRPEMMPAPAETRGIGDRGTWKTMAKRWSKLQKQIHMLVDPKVPLRVHCIDAGGVPGSLKRLGIFRVHLGKQVVWNFPEGLVTRDLVYPGGGDCFSYSVSDINRLVRDYIDTPRDALPQTAFPDDRFGLTEILKAADRRLGRGRLQAWFRESRDPVIKTILALRFGQGDGAPGRDQHRKTGAGSGTGNGDP